MTKLSLVFIWVAFLAGCTKKAATIPPATLVELQSQVETILRKKLSEQPDFKQMNEFKILDVAVDTSAGLVSMDYRASFDTESTEEGRVSHASQAKVTVERKSEREWSLKSNEPNSQELVFQDSVILSPGQ